jgi:hypothetical protein
MRGGRAETEGVRRRLVFPGLMLLAASGARAGNAWVPLTVQETAGIARIGSLVTQGVPLPRGRVTLLSQLRILDLATGAAVPAQFETLATWPDGSVRWVLADFPADVAAYGTAAFALTQDPFTPAPAPQSPLIVVPDPGGGLAVGTGVAGFRVASGRLLDAARLAGMGDVIAPGACDVVLTAAGRTLRASADPGATPVLEESGPLRAVIRVDGTFRDAGGSMLAYRARLRFVAGGAGVTISLTVKNGQAATHPNNVWDLGSAGSVLFDDLSLVVPLQGPGPRTFAAWGETNVESGPFTTSAVLYQESSGGNRWDWPTHVNRFNVVPMTMRGYEIRVDATPRANGNRSPGFLDVLSPATGLAAGVRESWQNFPKAVRAIAAPAALSIGLWPDEFPDQHELQGGEEKEHVIALWFHGPGVSPAEVEARLLELTHPLRARPQFDAVSRSGALPPMGPVSPAAFPDWENTCRFIAFDAGDRSFFTQREEIDEYGWRNFGEAFADHETDCGTQCWDCPVSHDNNQYDTDWAALAWWLRSGEPEWLQLGDEGVRHLRDVDVYHTDADTPAYDRGLFWHTTHDTNAYTCTHRSFSALMSPACTPYLSGGPGLGHLYTEGLLLHGYLTGDRRSFEVHEELERYLVTRYALDAPTPGSSYEPRAWANALTTAVEGYRRSGDQALLDLATRIVLDSETATNPAHDGTNFGHAMLMKALGRYLQLESDLGLSSSPDAQRALRSLQDLARNMRANYPPQQDVLDFRCSDGMWWAHAFTPPGDPDEADFAARGRAFFQAGERTAWFNTYITNKGLAHVATNGHPNAWFEQGRVPEEVTDLRVRRAGDNVVLSWSPVMRDAFGKTIAVGEYRLHRSTARPTRFGDAPLATSPATSFTAAGDAIDGTLRFYEVRAVASPGLEGP